MIYGQQDFFFLATWWVGYFFTAVQELFFSITFVLYAIFFFRQALAGNFFQNHPPPPSRVKWSAPYILPLIEHGYKSNEYRIRVEVLILLSPVLGVQVVHSFARIVPAEQQEKD